LKWRGELLDGNWQKSMEENLHRKNALGWNKVLDSG